jgi:hypothetical protein
MLIFMISPLRGAPTRGQPIRVRAAGDSWLVCTERVWTVADSAGHRSGCRLVAFGVDTTSHATLKWPAQVGLARPAARPLNRRIQTRARAARSFRAAGAGITSLWDVDRRDITRFFGKTNTTAP